MKLTSTQLDDYELALDRIPAFPVVYRDPSDFLYETTGRILRGRSLVGRFKFYYVDFAAALNAQCSAHDVLDSYAQTEEFADSVIGDGDQYCSRRLNQLLQGDVHEMNVLIIDRLEIQPAFRGGGVGLFVIRKLIERFSSGAGVIALKAFPLQFEVDRAKKADPWSQRMALASFPLQKRSASAALRRYYGRLGFIAMPRTDFMFMSSTARLPSVEELLNQSA